MFYKPLLLPLIIQVALTFLVLIRMYQMRIAEIRGRDIDPQDFSTRSRAGPALQTSAASSDNFVNLFETPVLFYTAILLSLVLMLQDPVIVALAWMYVILRALHSLVHTTYNRVVHRFYLYIMSCLALLGIWVRLGWYVIVS
ncbi:MAG: hypothetical protein GWM87_09700 [Xanthomonadales bacterium]|nr:hypothetical protein [Xanthomonadales bacterium]NIX13173.1 hypothetical protein [Xanthomonadales bacterium]